MKIVIEPTRLNRLLSTVLIYRGKPLLDSIVGEFKPNGVAFRDMKLEVAAVHAIYSPYYFMEYEAGNEEIPLTASLLNRLGWGFKDEKVTLMTSENHLVLKGSKETYNEPLLDVEKGEFVLKLKSSEYGFISVKEPAVRVLLTAEALSLPSAEKYRLDCNGEELRVTIEDVGRYTKTFKLSKKPILTELAVSFDGAYFQQMVGNLTGEVWLSLTEGGVVFSQKTKDFALSYLLSSLEE